MTTLQSSEPSIIINSKGGLPTESVLLSTKLISGNFGYPRHWNICWLILSKNTKDESGGKYHFDCCYMSPANKRTL